MFNTRFNNGYQNIPQQNIDMNGYNIMPQDPYAAYNPDPSLMNNVPYPTPPAEVPGPTQTYNPAAYAKGGNVQKTRQHWAQKLRKMGNNGDTDLVHVNPLEKRMLKSMGGSGTKNKKTGLRQYGFFNKPGKATKAFFTKPKRALAETVGLGGAIFGGPLGGAIGGGAKEAILGRPNNILSGALMGGLQGAVIPGIASLAGSGLNSLGATGLGEALQNYGTSNMGSWMGNLGQVGGGVSGLWDSIGGGVFGGGSSAAPLAAAAAVPAAVGSSKNSRTSGVSAGDSYEDDKGKKETAEEKGFWEKLFDNTGDYLSKPKNLLTLASVLSAFNNRPKEEKPKTPEQIADEQKRLDKALRLTPEERAAKEADLLAEARMRREIALNQFLPKERLVNLEPLHRKSHTPEEQRRYDRWFSYYNNPNFTGEPLPFKKGGNVLSAMIKEGSSIRSEVVNKAKKLTSEIIEKNKSQHNGLLHEPTLIRDFANLDKTLGLTEEEKDTLEKYTENIFRNNQFTTGPGYFYNQAHANPLVMKMGGNVPDMNPPSGLIGGRDGGQDDTIPAGLPDKAYIVEASTLSDLGDGNSLAGADKVKALVSSGEYYISPEDVARFGKLGAKKLDRLVKNVRKHKRGGRTTLPPKAKPLSSYLK